MTKINLTLTIIFAVQLLFSNCGNTNQEVAKSEPVAQTSKPTDEKVDVIVDFKTINRKTLSEVEKVLGKAESTEKVKGYPCEKSKCQKAFFKNGNYEIIFKNNKSDRITIYEIPNLTGKDNAILSLGLSEQKPSFKNINNVIRWKDVGNINEISFFPNYVLVQITKPD